MGEVNEFRVDLERQPFSLRKLLYFLPLLCLAALLGVMYAYSPLQVGPVGILLVFALFYGFCLSINFIFIKFITFLYSHIAQRKASQISLRKAYYISSVLAFLPIFLLALNSIGQLRLLDFLLVLSLVVVASFYIFRRVR